MNRLLPPAAGVPLPGPAPVTAVGTVVDHVFWSALGRAPSAPGVKSRKPPSRIATTGKASADAVADLLWAY